MRALSIAYSENQYWMTTHLDINFMIAHADFRLFEEREVEKKPQPSALQHRENVDTLLCMSIRYP